MNCWCDIIALTSAFGGITNERTDGADWLEMLMMMIIMNGEKQWQDVDYLLTHSKSYFLLYAYPLFTHITSPVIQSANQQQSNEPFSQQPAFSFPLLRRVVVGWWRRGGMCVLPTEINLFLDTIAAQHSRNWNKRQRSWKMRSSRRQQRQQRSL